MKILIVDDKTENIFALNQVLNDIPQYCFDIIKTTSGNGAVTYALTNKFDIILMDIKMPDMDGFEAAKLIRRDGKNKKTMIIFFSAFYKYDLTRMGVLTSGGIELIEKPIDEEELSEKIKEYVELVKYRENLTLRSNL